MANILVKMLLDSTGYERGLQGAAGRTKAFEQAAGTVASTVGKLAGAFGVAMGGAEAFERVIRGSQTTSDEFDRVMRSVKATVDSFFTALSTADFTAFSYGLGEIISKARAANDALDQLGNTTMSYGYFSSKERATFMDALKVLRDKNSTEADLKAAEAQMRQSLESLQSMTEVYAKRSAETMSSLVVEGTLLSAGQITQARIDDVLRLDVSTMGNEEKAALDKRYEEYRKTLEEVKAKYSRDTYVIGSGGARVKNGPEIVDMEGFEKAMEPINAMYLDAIVYKAMLDKNNDEWLQQLINISRAANDARRSLAKMYNQQREGLNAANTTRKERLTGGVPKSIGGGKKKPAYIDVGLTEMQGIGSVGVADSALSTEIELPVDALEEYRQKMEQVRKKQEQMADGAMYAGQMFSAMGSMAAQMGNKALAGMLNSFSAVSQMVVQLQALATAQGVTNALKLPWPASLGAIATVLSTVATIWSSLNFAEGGIVPGRNYMDGITARVSSGEMVINEADQKRLYDAIHTGNVGGGGGGRMVVNGEQIVEVINNYGRRTGRGRLSFR